MKELWNYEGTEPLLQLVKANYTRLNDKKTTEVVVWKDITRVLQELVSYYVGHVSSFSYRYSP